MDHRPWPRAFGAPPQAGRRVACCLLMAAGTGFSAMPVAAAEVTEASVKAAYLYRFLAYVEWPAGTFAAPDAPLVIGVIGADAVAAELAPVVASRQAQGHPLTSRKLLPGDTLDGVHVLHLGRGSRPPAALAGPAPRTMLVVTDEPTGLPEYATLNFVTAGQRVRFEASLRAAERARLKLSARLLEVAERVQPP